METECPECGSDDIGHSGEVQGDYTVYFCRKCGNVWRKEKK